MLDQSGFITDNTQIGFVSGETSNLLYATYAIPKDRDVSAFFAANMTCIHNTCAVCVRLQSKDLASQSTPSKDDAINQKLSLIACYLMIFEKTSCLY